MTQLVALFDEEGLDRETQVFLCEALSNAEADDYAGMLEGFIPPPADGGDSKALALVLAQPHLVEEAAAYLQKELEAEAAAAAAEAAKPPPNSDSMLLAAFILGWKEGGENAGDGRWLPGVLAWVDPHSLARLSRLCPRAAPMVRAECTWQPRVRRMYEMQCWDPAELRAEESWRAYFFSKLRPRFDGIYVGECRYVHYIRPGSSMDAKLATKSFHWVDYRRFVRLLPPAEDGERFALVLRDTCSFKAAEEVMLDTDPRTHENIYEHDGPSGQHRGPGVQATTSRDKLRERVSVGRWSYTAGPALHIDYEISCNQYALALELDHGAGFRFSGKLAWKDYSMTDNKRGGEVIPYNLGRKHAYGFWYEEPADHEKDHFPSMLFRASKPLAYLL